MGIGKDVLSEGKCACVRACVCVCVCQRKTKDRADGMREKVPIVGISVTSPAALAFGENAPHLFVWSAWHSGVMPLSGRLYDACVCWRQWHLDRQIEEAWSVRSMHVLSKSAKGIIFFVFCVDFEAVFLTCSVHCQSWKRRFLDSTASVL